MKKILASIVVFSFLSSMSYATNYDMTFENAREKAIQNSEKLKIRQEIIDSLEKKYETQKKDPYQNKPDYEYDGINKIPVYTNGYKTYDYEKLLKNAKEDKKKEIIENEQKTMSLFSDVLSIKNEIQNKNLKLEQSKNDLKQAEAKLKNNTITKLEYETYQMAVENEQSSIKVIQEKLSLSIDKLKNHIGLSKKDNINLILKEPKLDMLIPSDMMKKLYEKKEFLDLSEDLKNLNEDMSWIELINYGSDYTKNVKKQQKLIDEKKQDIDELKRQTNHNYDVEYYKILIKANEIRLNKIEKKSLEMKKEKQEKLYKVGNITKTSIGKLDLQIQENILSQLKKQLEIRQLLLDYNE